MSNSNTQLLQIKKKRKTVFLLYLIFLYGKLKEGLHIEII